MLLNSCILATELTEWLTGAGSVQFTRSSTCSVAPGTTAGISAGLLPGPEGVQLLASVLGGRQHVQVALLLAEPAGVLAEEDRGRHPQDYPIPHAHGRAQQAHTAQFSFIFSQNWWSPSCGHAAFRDGRTPGNRRS